MHKIGICSLRGNTLQPDVYRPLLQKAFAQKIIGQDQYKRMMYTLRYGADLFIDQDALALLPDRIFRRNYPSAYENSEAVTKAILARVRSGKTLKLGYFRRSEFPDLPVKQAICFPMGAVVKPHDPTEYRPFGDHTKSRLNEAGRPWSHSLKALDEFVINVPGFETNDDLTFISILFNFAS